MEEYLKYQHVEKLGNTEVDGILFGECYIFPKLDGTNSHVWKDRDGVVHFGSRNRELSLGSDNAGFMAWGVDQDWSCLGSGDHLFGEWLVPHSLKTYRDDAWRKFYVFDGLKDDGRYYSYDELKSTYGCLNIIEPISIITNPKLEDIQRCLDENKYLIKDGSGVGEGVVIKNYEFVNKFGRVVWGKMVTNGFKDKHTETMGGAPRSSGTSYVEERIVSRYLSKDVIDKVYANICNDVDGWSSKYIPRLLSTVFYDFVRESSWDFVKGEKFPVIDYKVLKGFVEMKVKETLNF